MVNVKLIRTFASNSAANLAKSLGIKRNKLKVWEPRLFKKDKFLINWGNSKIFNFGNRVIWNNPRAVQKAVNKQKTFEALREAGISIPEFYITPQEVPERTDKSRYIARSILNGHSGQGITVVDGTAEFPANTKLITKYIKKKVELRVHVAFGKVILTVQKRRRNELQLEGEKALIRSYNNGWIFSTNISAEVTQDHLDMAIRAVQALGLDFGAVDMVLDYKTNLPYVLEVNTAPAIEAQTTREAYMTAFTNEAAAQERVAA